MKKIFLIIDWEGDAPCAATTERGAKEIIEEARQEGNDGYRIEEICLYDESD